MTPSRQPAGVGVGDSPVVVVVVADLHTGGTTFGHCCNDPRFAIATADCAITWVALG